MLLTFLNLNNQKSTAFFSHSEGFFRFCHLSKSRIEVSPFIIIYYLCNYFLQQVFY